MSSPTPQPAQTTPSPVMFSASSSYSSWTQPSHLHTDNHDLQSGAPSVKAEHRRRMASIIVELTRLHKDEQIEQALPVHEEKIDGRLDARILQEGAATFHRFQKHMECLDDGLQEFTHEVQQLSSSIGLRFYADKLRTRLTQLLHTFCENASAIFHVERIPKKKLAPIKRFSIGKPRRAHKPTKKSEDEIRSDPELLPEQLDELATYLNTFLQHLSIFPEFDGAFNTAAYSFCDDLEYWASCLRDFKDQLHQKTMRLHVNDLMVEFGDHAESITEALSTFVKIGVPTIRTRQKQTNDALLNLSTVATFLSAVTATTLQFSYESYDTHLEKAVNILWLVSLVFSLASAINSQLTYFWRSSIYRSPLTRVPWWVSIWITGTPLVFLVASGVAFSAGLVCFSFTKFPRFIATVTTAATSISSLALIVVVSWLFGERYAYSHTKGKRWLADILDNAVLQAKKYSGYDLLRTQMAGLLVSIQAVVAPASCHPEPGDISLEEQDQSFMESSDSYSLPFAYNWKSSSPPVEPKPAVSMAPTTSLASNSNNTISSGIRSKFQAIVQTVMHQTKAVAPVGENTDYQTASATAASHSLEVLPAGKGTSDSTNPLHSSPRHASSSPAQLPMFAKGDPYRPRPDTLQSGHQKNPSRLAKIQTALSPLEITQHYTADAFHTAPVKHLQFSPNGKWLATCSEDNMAIIWEVGRPFKLHRKLKHSNACVSRVAWHQDGMLLLTKTSTEITTSTKFTKVIGVVQIWNLAEDGALPHTIERERDIQSVTWIPKSTKFISVEGPMVYVIDLTGKVVNKYNLEPLHLHHVTIIPDGQRLLAVGRLDKSRDGLNPTKSRKEKRIIVFNLESERIESQVPVYHEVRNFTLSSGGTLALVSYEHKAPQLFQIDTRNNAPARIELRHTYLPSHTSGFAGPSSLGPIISHPHNDPHIVLCAGKAGEIHIWDQESTLHLRSLPADAQGSDLVCIAWNSNPAPTSSLMFASASDNGILRIWAAPLQPLQSPPPSTSRNPQQHPLGNTQETPNTPVTLVYESPLAIEKSNPMDC